FDGVMLGHSSSPYHLDFTTHHLNQTQGHGEGQAEGQGQGRALTKINLQVFYLSDRGQWVEAVRKMENAGAGAVEAVNLY
ncbi:hypothetical protein T440DRAFT_381378, partial [Plenodomus tracheiphilus IPT5]